MSLSACPTTAARSPGLAAVTLGASALEVHVTLSRASFGPDVTSSLTFEELAELVRGVRFVGTALANPAEIDKAAAARRHAALFTRSVALATRCPLGTC
jgi:N,N'-diacetyllegionaminate synthase